MVVVALPPRLGRDLGVIPEQRGEDARQRDRPEPVQQAPPSLLRGEGLDEAVEALRIDDVTSCRGHPSPGQPAMTGKHASPTVSACCSPP